MYCSGIAFVVPADVPSVVLSFCFVSIPTQIKNYYYRIMAA